MRANFRRFLTPLFSAAWLALVWASSGFAQEPTPTRGPSPAALERGSSNLDIILGASVLVIIIVGGVLINARLRKKD